MLSVQKTLRLLHDVGESLLDDGLFDDSAAMPFGRVLFLLDLQILVFLGQLERKVFQLYLVQVLHISHF